MPRKGKKKWTPDQPLKNARHEAFAQARFLGASETEAAIKAGYSKKTARQQGSRLLTKVDIQARIEFLQKKVEGSNIITREECLKVLAEIVRTALPDLAGFDTEGVHFADIGPETQGKRAVKELTTRKTFHKSGKGKEKEEWETVIAGVKLHDPIKAIEVIAKILGWDKRRLDVFMHKAEELTDAELQAIAQGEE